MALLPGYFPSTYFPINYWNEDYWQDYDRFVMPFECRMTVISSDGECIGGLFPSLDLFPLITLFPSKSGPPAGRIVTIYPGVGYNG